MITPLENLEVLKLADHLFETARQINAFVKNLKTRRNQKSTKSIGEKPAEYIRKDSNNHQIISENDIASIFNL